MPPLESAEGASGAVGAVDERHGVDVAGAGLRGVQLKVLEVEPDLRIVLINYGVFSHLFRGQYGFSLAKVGLIMTWAETVR